MGYETGYSIGYLLGGLIWSLAWGFATAAVRERRGYGRRWFWFGFFLGLIPFIIACSIPAKPDENDPSIVAQEENYRFQNTVAGGGWVCSCGRTNAAYVSTCTCGLGKRKNNSSITDEINL